MQYGCSVGGKGGERERGGWHLVQVGVFPVRTTQPTQHSLREEGGVGVLVANLIPGCDR